ncbi:hypothetical protein Ndes2437A_g03041 [Nannochloris sp. 'desiccata']
MKLLPLVCIFVYLLNIYYAKGALIAVGKLESCFNNGTDALDCAKKIVVTLALENNRLYQTESLNFNLACIDSPTGQCPCPCHHAYDPSCTCRDLRRVISVAVTKSPVFAVYPLSQPRTFNGRPYEEFIPTGPGGTFSGSCSESPYAAEPTCGWATAPDGSGYTQAIPDSQGFCCTCPTFAATARSPSSTVAIIAAASPTAVSSSSSSQEELRINPSRGFVLNSDRSVSARLLGDLDSYRQIQNLDGHWVMIPVEPGVDPNSIYTQNEDMWVILPPTMVTTTGECDKVGVGYTAFRIQSEKCDQPLGSCLRNQLYDLGEEDNARVASGMEPLYNISRYGGGKRNLDQIQESADNLSLRLPIKGIRTSLVTLEVKADDVQLVVNRAPGKILSSEVCTFDGVHCGGFTAISGTGFLKVKVQNTGAVAAEFRAGILGCSGGVLPAVEEYASIAPASTHDFSFDLRMESDQEGNRTCTVVVTDAAGDIADSTLVSFYTNATVYEPPPDQSDLGDKPGIPGDPPNFNKCSTLCPNLFNIKCLIFKGCWKRLIQAASTIALIGGVIIVLAVAIKQGWITKCIKIIECCLPKYKKRLERSGEIHRRPDDGSGPGQVAASGRKRSRFKGIQGEEALEDDKDNNGDETIAPSNNKMNIMRTNGGLSFADAATAALAAKQWRHHHQQLSLRQQHEQLQMQLQQQQQEQQQIQVKNQLIGAYFDYNNSGASTTSSPTYSPTPSQMMFYSPQASPGPPVPMSRLQPPSAPLLALSPHLTRAQTFQAHMFQPQQQCQDFSPPSPGSLRRWNTFTPNSPPPQYTAFNNPLSWKQEQQKQIEINSNSTVPYAVGSPGAQFQQEEEEEEEEEEQLQQQYQYQQQQPVATPCWLVNTTGENDDVAMTIGPMSAPLNLPQAFSKAAAAAADAAQPMQTKAPPPPPSSSGTYQDT